MILIRIILINLIIFLLIRSFVRSGSSTRQEKKMSEPKKPSGTKSRAVSKEVGEYVDYEEVDN